MKRPIDPAGVARRKVERIGERPGGATDELDAVVAEEPLEIRVDGETIGVTMRTPGDDARLALGFLFGEGIISSLQDVGTVSHCGRPGQDGWGNVMEVRSGPGVSLDADRILEGRRFVPTSSACGVCGRQTIDDLIARCGTLEGGAVLQADLVLRAVDRMRAAQIRFERTGGLHAAAAFDAAGEMLCCHEDVGRHNAVDKVVGELLRFGLVGAERRGSPPALLVVSGRAGFEIVQKAAVAKIPIVASVSATTSLAIDLAQSTGLTLAGFARNGSLNVYTHPWRITAGDGRGRLRAVPDVTTPGPGPAQQSGATGGTIPGSGRDGGTSARLGGYATGSRVAAAGGYTRGFSMAAQAAPLLHPDVDETVAWFDLDDPELFSPPQPGPVAEDEERRRLLEAMRQAEERKLHEAVRRDEEARLRYHAEKPLAVQDAAAEADEAAARERRRSLAAELVARTDRMIAQRRAAGRRMAPEDGDEALSFDGGGIREEVEEIRAGADALEAALQRWSEPPPKPRPAAPQRPADVAPADQKPVLIDDRDPGNPSLVFWPGGNGWSTGRVR